MSLKYLISILAPRQYMSSGELWLENIILNLVPHSLSTVLEDVSTGKQGLYLINPLS